MSNVIIQGFPSSGAYTQADIRGYKSYAASIIYNGSTWVVKELQNDLGFPMIWTFDEVECDFTCFLNFYTPPVIIDTIANNILCFGNPGGWYNDSYKIVVNYNKEENYFRILGLDNNDNISNIAFADTDNFRHASIEIRIYP